MIQFKDFESYQYSEFSAERFTPPRQEAMYSEFELDDGSQVKLIVDAKGFTFLLYYGEDDVDVRIEQGLEMNFESQEEAKEFLTSNYRKLFRPMDYDFYSYKAAMDQYKFQVFLNQEDPSEAIRFFGENTTRSSKKNIVIGENQEVVLEDGSKVLLEKGDVLEQSVVKEEVLYEDTQNVIS